MQSSIKINKKKLAIEITIIAFVALIIFAPQFIHINPPNPYAKDQVLLNKVKNFDYDTGDHPSLYKEIEAQTSSIGREVVKYFFNLEAKALYHYNVGNYSASIATLNESIKYAPHDSFLTDIYGLYIDNYTALRDTKMIKQYKSKLAEIGNE